MNEHHGAKVGGDVRTVGAKDKRQEGAQKPETKVRPVATRESERIRLKISSIQEQGVEPGKMNDHHGSMVGGDVRTVGAKDKRQEVAQKPETKVRPAATRESKRTRLQTSSIQEQGVEPSKKQQEVVQRFQKLFAQTKSKESDELDAESLQGLLRTPETVAKFQVWDKSDFLPDMSNAMPLILEIVNLKPNLATNSAESDDDSIEKILEEKATACKLLLRYVDEFKEDFLPWIDQASSALVPLLWFCSCKEVQRAAIAALPKLLLSAKMAIEEGESQGRYKSYVTKLSHSVIPALVKAAIEEHETELRASMVDSLNECMQIALGGANANLRDEIVVAIFGPLPVEAFLNLRIALDVLQKENQVESDLYQIASSALMKVVQWHRDSIRSYELVLNKDKRAYWGLYDNWIFCKICLEKMESGYTFPKAFGDEEVDFPKMFFTKTGKVFKPDQFVNKWKGLKNVYNSWKPLHMTKDSSKDNNPTKQVKDFITQYPLLVEVPRLFELVIKLFKNCDNKIGSCDGRDVSEQAKVDPPPLASHSSCLDENSIINTLEDKIKLLELSNAEKEGKSNAEKEGKIKLLELSNAEKEFLEAKLAEKERRLEFLEAKLAEKEIMLNEAELLRKKLHNQMMDLKGNMRVFCRVKPLFGNAENMVSYPKSLEHAGRGIHLMRKDKNVLYTFDKVFDHTASQEIIFNEISELVQSVLDGYKVTIFSYGQTGSGKTYTMIGKPGADQKGIIPRALDEIFRYKKTWEDNGWTFDVKEASKHRFVDKTQKNEESSRSHFVFKLMICGHNKQLGQKVEGVLQMIDLAASETASKTEEILNKRKEEIKNINVSLLALGNLFEAIGRDKFDKFLPYRASKLTHLLQNFFVGDCKILMFVNINSELSSMGATLSSLDFAAKVHNCKIQGQGFAVPKESQSKVGEFSFKGTPAKIKHGDVVIAAITSCTNTSNPNVMLGAALVAKKACDLGLEVKPWIKTSLAPGSGVVKKYLDKSGLQKYLNQLGFNIVGYGCTTCIGNSGDLDESVAAAITDNDVVAAAVLSGNRNFEGCVHALARANYLASPPLVVAYALAGTVNIDFEKEPVGISKDGKEVYFRDIWPTTDEIAEVVKSSVLPDMFKGTYESITKGNPIWNELPVSARTLYPWDPTSTYIHEPPYFKDMTMTLPGARPVKDAYCLLNFGDSITTDHISPAGSIHPDSPAAKFLKERSVERKDFNSYGSRRGNDEIMARGTFANIRLVNKFLKGEVGAKTIHVPSGEKLAVFDAAMKYKEEGHDTIILAGAEYGSGSSRDWAAKGPMLQGVKAVIAKSFERIHRSNLAGMGIVPLCFKAGEDADSLGLTGHERYTVQLPTNVEDIKPGQDVTVTTDDGKSFTCKLRFDTEVEIAYYTHGGILPYVIRKIAAEQ